MFNSMNVFEVSLLVLRALMSLGQLHSSSTNCNDTTSCPNGYVEGSDEEFFEALDRIFPPTSEQDTEELSISVEPPEPEMWNAIQSSPMPHIEMSNENFDALHSSIGNVAQFPPIEAADSADTFEEDVSLSQSLSDEERSAKRDSIHAALLEKYIAASGSPSAKTIKWNRIIIVKNWPQSVLFYYPGNWTPDEMFALEASMNDIFFVTSESAPNLDKSEAKEMHLRLRQLNRELFYSTTIRWRKDIKSLMPDLHLTSPCNSKWTAIDLMKINDLIALLESLVNSRVAEAADCNDYCDEMPQVDLVAQGKCNGRILLLQKYRQDTGHNHAIIHWGNYKVTGWPCEVFFYSPTCWSGNDEELVAAAINNITFNPISDGNNGRTMYSKTDRSRLLKELQQLSKENFGSEQIPWRTTIRHLMSDLHLTCSRYSGWTNEDVDKIKAVIEQLRELPNGFVPKLRQESELLRLRLQRELVNKCNADLKSNYKEIPWSKVNVHNWPKGVSCNSSINWTVADITMLMNHMMSISFEYKITDNARRNFSLQERRVLAQRLAQISLTCFDSPQGIAWQHIKEMFPSLNLMLDRYEVWTIDECRQLTAIAEYCEREAPVSIKKSKRSLVNDSSNYALPTKAIRRTNTQ